MHGFDALTPVEETLRTLDDLVRAGKVRYIGCSNFSGWHLMKSLAVSESYGWPRYVAHQAYYSLVGRDYEWELMPLGLDQGVGAVVWSPLGWGRLTGKIRRGQPRAAAAARMPIRNRRRATRRSTCSRSSTRSTRWPRRPARPPADRAQLAPAAPTVANVIIGARNEEQLRREHRRRRLETDARAGGQARRGERRRARYPVWHQRDFPRLNEKAAQS